ncbi:MAG: helix-turn-helix transcriptional regulator [Chlorobia bacterium]|nr:helix-turn-helix transcriptional regulator [Fimbriimonadaceae bacterium]
MAEKPKWPGQIEEALFDLAQVRALASVVRAEVYWTFSTDEPMSTADVAKAISRGAATVRYHVNELLKADMLIAVETRKRKARTEDAYVHKIINGYTPRPPYEPDYLEAIHKGFTAIQRYTSREREAVYAVSNIEHDFYQLQLYRRSTIRLAPDQIAKLRRKLADVVYEFVPLSDPAGIQVNVSTYMSPTKGESERRYQELTGHELGDKPIVEPED